MGIVINHLDLVDFVHDICEASGSSGTEAQSVASNLVMANLMGHDSHGVGMLPRYIACVHSGTLTPNANAEIVMDSGALIVIDGQAGYGQVIGAQAMQIGITRAKQFGVGVVAIRNSFHLCRIGAWAEQCAEAGLVSMHHTNVIGHKPMVAPFGAKQARYATNPYTVGLPATNKTPMIILDMATSVVALGKVRVAKNKSESVAEGILLDSDGRPTTDPTVMYEQPFGAVLPFGEHKGGGLGLVTELLAGILTGGHTMRPETQPENDAIINNMLSVIIDPEKLTDMNRYQYELDATMAWIKAAAPLDEDAPVLAPGEPEQKMRIQREAHGIPIDDTTWQELVVTATAAGSMVPETVTYNP